VSRRCIERDAEVDAVLTRWLENQWPAFGVDATALQSRKSGRIVGVATIVAVAVDTDCRRPPRPAGLSCGPRRRRR
jgi:transposase-like protein